MSDYIFMETDLTNRIGEFGSKHFGVSVDKVALDDKLFEIATRLFWDHYFDSEVEL
jgi:hypothetical protein